MTKQKEFYDKPLFSLLNYFTWLLLGGFYFIILNIPLIIFYTMTWYNTNLFSIISLFICLIPFGLALGALYSSMIEIIKEKDISFSSYFFKSYKNNFKSNLKLWLIQLSLLTIFFIDYQYFYLKMPSLGLHIIFVILGIAVLILGLYAFPINCKFNLKFKDLLILSFYYAIRKFHLTILKLIVIALAFFFASRINAILVLFIPSILCFILTIYDKPIFSELEEKYLSQIK